MIRLQTGTSVGALYRDNLRQDCEYARTRRKMAMRAERAAATASTSSSTSLTNRAAGSSSSPAPWAPLGPAPLASDATGDDMNDHDYGASE